MKRTIAILLVFLLVCGLAACGGRGANKGKQTKVSVFWYSESDVYLSSVRDLLNKELESAGISYENLYADCNQSKQIDQIKSALNDGSNLLIINQVTAGSLATSEDILTIAGDVPVIFFNRALGSQEEPDLHFFQEHSNSCFIGTDPPEAGRLQGMIIGHYVMDHYEEIDLNGDGRISYAMFQGDQTDVEALSRTRYSVQDANLILNGAGKPSLQYFDPSRAESKPYQADLNGAWSAASAEEYMSNNLRRYNEANGNMIELIICNNDDMAEGAIAALQEKGYNQKGGHVIPVFGVDATAPARALIANGSMTATVKQDAQGLAYAIRHTAEEIMAGKMPQDALNSLKESRFKKAPDCDSKLYIAYAPYDGN